MKETYYLDSFIVFIPSNEQKVTKGGHYVAYKDFNNISLLCDDSEYYVSSFPDIPLNIYIAFYRYGPSSKKATVPNLEVDQLPNMPFSKIVSMFKAPEFKTVPTPTVDDAQTIETDNPQSQKSDSTQVKTSEGTFVPPHDKSQFMEQLKLQPKLLSEKLTPTKQVTKDDDNNYVPSTKNGTEDDEEDSQVDDSVEKPEKGYELILI